MIEVGRHARPIVPREQRFCPHCPNIVESEIHFLTECPVYYRAPLFTKVMVNVPQFAQLDEKSKFLYLMSQEDQLLTQELAKQAHFG